MDEALHARGGGEARHALGALHMHVGETVAPPPPPPEDPDDEDEDPEEEEDEEDDEEPESDDVEPDLDAAAVLAVCVFVFGTVSRGTMRA